MAGMMVSCLAELMVALMGLLMAVKTASYLVE